MGWWGHSGPVAGAAPPASNKIYVEAGIVHYCMANKLNLASYCKSIEPALGGFLSPESEFISYNPNDPNHSSDIVSNGALLISTGLSQHPVIQKKAEMGTEKLREAGYLNPPSRILTPQEIGIDTSQKSTVSILKSLGVDYSSKADLRDPDDIKHTLDSEPQGFNLQKPSAPKQQRPVVNTLLSLLGADGDEEPD